MYSDAAELLLLISLLQPQRHTMARNSHKSCNLLMRRVWCGVKRQKVYEIAKNLAMVLAQEGTPLTFLYGAPFHYLESETKARNLYLGSVNCSLRETHY